MHTQQYLIQTGIDGFIRLIRARNRISLGEAARELGLPGNIVNNWAYFLEELGIVRISYGLKDIVVEVNKPGNTELLKEEDRMISNVNQMRIHHANLQDSRAEAKRNWISREKQASGPIPWISIQMCRLPNLKLKASWVKSNLTKRP